MHVWINIMGKEGGGGYYFIFSQRTRGQSFESRYAFCIWNVLTTHYQQLSVENFVTQEGTWMQEIGLDLIQRTQLEDTTFEENVNSKIWYKLHEFGYR